MDCDPSRASLPSSWSQAAGTERQRQFGEVWAAVAKIIPADLGAMSQWEMCVTLTWTELMFANAAELDIDWARHVDLAIVFELIDLSFRLHRHVQSSANFSAGSSADQKRNGVMILLGDYLLTEASKRALKFEDMGIQGCIARFMRSLAETSLLLLELEVADEGVWNRSSSFGLVRSSRTCVQSVIEAGRFAADGYIPAAPHTLVQLFTALAILRCATKMPKWRSAPLQLAPIKVLNHRSGQHMRRVLS